MKNRWLSAFTLVFLTINGLFAQFPKYLYGITSWYGEEYRGKKTASGELFNPDAMTGAHRTLPFGTQLEVENLENGKKVIITINDRGPFVESRILDLSKAAAEHLGFLKKGTAYVKVVVLRLGHDSVDNSHDDVESTEEARKKASESSSSSSSVSPVSSSSSSSSSKNVSVKTTVVSSASSETKNEIKESENRNITPETNIIHVVVAKTNEVFLTNVVVKTVTNESVPYREHLVERGLPEPVSSNLNVDLEDGFVEEEPLLNDENTVIDILINSNKSVENTANKVSATTQSIPVTNQIVDFDSEPVPPLTSQSNLSKFDDLIGFLTDEGEVTPDILLSNETALKVEEMSLSNELSGELKNNNKITKFSESNNANNINKTSENTKNNIDEPEDLNINSRIDFADDTDNAENLEIDIPEDIVSNESISDTSIHKITTITNMVILTNEITNMTLVNNDIQSKTNKKIIKEPVEGLNYVVQVGAFRKEGNALGLYDFLREKGMDVFTTETVVKTKRYIRVRLGYYTSQQQALKVLKQVQELHLPGMIVKINVKD